MIATAMAVEATTVSMRTPKRLKGLKGEKKVNGRYG
jgi:hypothetical protein